MSHLNLFTIGVRCGVDGVLAICAEVMSVPLGESRAVVMFEPKELTGIAIHKPKIEKSRLTILT